MITSAGRGESVDRPDTAEAGGTPVGGTGRRRAGIGSGGTRLTRRGRIVGWVAGNVYVSRRGSSPLPRRALLAIYLGGPPGLIWLLWAFVPVPVQVLSPLVPFLSLAIFGIFFLVPVTLRRR